MTQQPVVVYNYGYTQGTVVSNVARKNTTTPATIPVIYSISSAFDLQATAAIRKDDGSGNTLASPNNQLQQRRNQVRIGGRVPDIFGSVRSIPDILCLSYTYYVANIQYTKTYYCVSRGDCQLGEVADEADPFDSLSTHTYTRYGPSTSPSGLIAPVISKMEHSLPLLAPNDTFVPENGVNIAGPFVFDNIKGTVLNFQVARSTPYTSWDVDIEVNYQQLDADGNNVGTPHVRTFSLGTTETVKTYTDTFTTLPFTGRVSVTVERTNNNATSGSFVIAYSSASLISIYGVYNTGTIALGDVTTIETVIEGRDMSSSFEFVTMDQPDEVLLNCLATRSSNSEYSSYASDIVREIALDDRIGNKTVAQVDFLGLLQAQAQAIAHFGTIKAVQFNHTFDDSDISFEETIITVCTAAFITVFREEETIRFAFKADSLTNVLIFNHRNKVVDTEQRQLTFGPIEGRDGVEYDYVDITDGATLQVVLPSDGSATNPTSTSVIGITNRLQAYFHAWRQQARQQHQNTVIDFEATQEANLLNPGDRIIVTDNTRPGTFDGEIVDKTGLTLTLSQPFTFAPSTDYSIFIQMTNGTVEEIGISEVSGQPYKVLLDSDITASISTDTANFARALFEILDDTAVRRGSFIVQEKRPNGILTVGISAVNFDSRFFDHDKDFINAVVDADGEII